MDFCIIFRMVRKSHKKRGTFLEYNVSPPGTGIVFSLLFGSVFVSNKICTVNLKDFGTIAKDIYGITLILEGSTCSYIRDNLLYLYIFVVDGKLVTGIYHKVDDFNFEVISYPFPDSNVHSMLGYKTFYSQLTKGITNRFCYKLIKRGHEKNLLQKSFLTFCWRYQICAKYDDDMYKYLFFEKLTFDNYVVCNIVISYRQYRKATFSENK